MIPESDDEATKISVLVIGGNCEVWNTIQTYLAQAPDFALVGLVATGSEGIEKAQKLQPNLILIDYNTGDIDSVAVINLVMGVAPCAGIIMMSTSNPGDWVEKSFQAGVHDFLTKPLDIDSFYSTLRDTYEWCFK